jgi:hypothetical protein
MIAAVHAGEMVIPSRGGVADEFRNFMSGGGFDTPRRSLGLAFVHAVAVSADLLLVENIVGTRYNRLALRARRLARRRARPQRAWFPA